MDKDWVTRHSGTIGHSVTRHSFYLALGALGRNGTGALGKQSPRRHNLVRVSQCFNLLEKISIIPTNTFILPDLLLCLFTLFELIMIDVSWSLHDLVYLRIKVFHMRAIPDARNMLAFRFVQILYVWNQNWIFFCYQMRISMMKQVEGEGKISMHSLLAKFLCHNMLFILVQV